MKRDSLVLYRMAPARVIRLGKKLQIELPDGETLSVRQKDIELLHLGPLEDLGSLSLEAFLTDAALGEMKTAWELLAGTTTSLAELAALAYGTFSPATAWAVWQWVADGLYFQGTPDAVNARSQDDVAREVEIRAARSAEERAWEEAMRRFRAGQTLPGDARFLRDVEELALGRTTKSRVLQHLGRSESPEAAHAFLLETGHWDYTANPYPQRLRLPSTTVAAFVPGLPDEERVDLTHLQAFAIDDAGNEEPDDALSIDDNRLWVHVADVAALIPPESPADLEARGRGASLYLPEGTVQMLPARAIATCGLGLGEVSPALSIGVDLDADGLGLVTGSLQIVPSWVRVTRLTYEEAEARLDEEPLLSLHRLASRHQALRFEGNAVWIDLPEVRIQVESDEAFTQGRVAISPVPSLRSRELVMEAMLIAGTAVGRLALENQIPIPYTTQNPPRMDERPRDLAGMFALRRNSYPSDYSLVPGLHAGLGLTMYVQATSPLRRYLDLVVHQQLRAFLRGEELLSPGEVLERVGAAMAVTDSIRQAERQTRLHWTLVYLLQHPEWEGEGILVELPWQRSSRGRSGVRGTVLIPELDLTVQVYLRQQLPLNSRVCLAKPVVNLPALSVHLQVV